MALSSSSSSGLCVESDLAGTLFFSVVCQSAISVWWAGPSTPSVTISKETFSPLFFAGSERGWSLHWRLHHCYGLISGSLDPITYRRIPHRFHNREMCISLPGVPAWSFFPLGWMCRLRIRIYEVYRRSVPSLTIVLKALQAWLLSMATCWSHIPPFAILRPRIPASVRSARALSSPSPGSCEWSVLPLHSAWVCKEWSFDVGSRFKTGTIWRLRGQTGVSSLGVLCGSLIRVATERRPQARRLST